MPPKMFATDGSENDPVVVYKFYAQKRPEKMNEDDSPFYLAVNYNLKAQSLQTKEWFKVGPAGMNKLNSLMKTMAQKAGINNERLRNYSGRKTMIQTLSENDIPPTRPRTKQPGNPAISPSNSESQQSMALFSGAVIKGGNFSIKINTVNQSPKPTLEESRPSEALPRWKRLKPLEDSDDE